MYLNGLTPEVLAQAHEHAKTAPRNLDGQAFRFFTPQQAADYAAFAEQVIPTDDTPGAKEANVVRFTDFALSETEPQNKKDFAEALKAFHEQAKKATPPAASFAALTPAQQIEMMKAMEKSPDFGILKNYVLIAFFCDPSDSGNKNKVGWKLIGFEDKYYYAPAARRTSARQRRSSHLCTRTLSKHAQILRCIGSA